MARYLFAQPKQRVKKVVLAKFQAHRSPFSGRVRSFQKIIAKSSKSLFDDFKKSSRRLYKVIEQTC
jgi:hypothetical protein